MTPEQELQRENESLRHLLARAGLHAAQQDVARKLQRLMLEELHHRIKNTLATVQAIVSQSFRTTDTVEKAQDAIRQRLQALGRVHDLLLRTSWIQASLSSVVAAAIEPYAVNSTPQFTITSPDIDVAPAGALPLAMVLNELCTNASKYGALSVPEGRVDISAQIDADGSQIRVTWTESGGPLVAEPTRRSFGTRLIEQSLLRTIQGEGKIQYLPTGVVCVIAIPLHAIQPPASVN